jgi:hypothetical protein
MAISIERLAEGFKIECDGQQVICSEHNAKRIFGGLYMVLFSINHKLPKGIAAEIDFSDGSRTLEGKVKPCLAP